MDRIKANQGNEKFPKLNFFDEHLKLACSISDEKLRELPELLPGEQVCMLGSIEKRGTGPATLRVTSLLAGLPKTEDERETDASTAGERAVNIANPVVLRGRAQEYIDENPDRIELKGSIFLGEIRSTALSEADVQDILKAYQEDFKPHQPYLVGVLKPNEAGVRTLILQRVVQQRGKSSYYFKGVERLEKSTE